MAVVAVVSAAAAFWVTIDARFLQYPAWSAVQKADFILGPVFVGLYWHYRRPHNRLGTLLIILGLLAIPYIGASSTAPTLFAPGVALAELSISFMLIAVILAFPSGRIEGVAAKVTLASALALNVVTGGLYFLTARVATPIFPISGCRAACPRNVLAIWSQPSWLPSFNRVDIAWVIAVDIATGGILVWRVITGTPSRRRALSIGIPAALVFLATDASYVASYYFSPDGFAGSAPPVHSALQWTDTVGRSVLWYGFLVALVAAELFAGRTLRRLVRDSLGRPSFRELEGMLRRPLGDPGLRLGFWRSGKHDWADAAGAALAPQRSDQRLTEFDRDGRRAIAIVHDAQLSEDPELLQAAGAVALLAQENAELDSAWKDSLGELADSQARLVSAGDRERRKLERDLHDGAQQRLMALQIKLQAAQDHADTELAEELGDIRVDATEAVEELRALARGIYPPILRERGVADALRSVAMTAPIPIKVHDEGIGRCEGATEAAIYFCALEAIQNTIKHAGDHPEVVVTLERDPGRVRFTVADDGVGMNTGSVATGMGLTDMRDRIGAVGGELELTSSPGQGTVIRGTVPDSDTPTGSRRPHRREKQAQRA